jgi:hypothetical protein
MDETLDRTRAAYPHVLLLSQGLSNISFFVTSLIVALRRDSGSIVIVTPTPGAAAYAPAIA